MLSMYPQVLTLHSPIPMSPDHKYSPDTIPTLILACRTGTVFTSPHFLCNLQMDPNELGCFPW